MISNPKNNGNIAEAIVETLTEADNTMEVPTRTILVVVRITTANSSGEDHAVVITIVRMAADNDSMVRTLLAVEVVNEADRILTIVATAVEITAEEIEAAMQVRMAMAIPDHLNINSTANSNKFVQLQKINNNK